MRLRLQANRERGSVTLWAILSVMVALVVMGLVVDGGGQMRASQQANQAAREAARAAAQAVTSDPVIGQPGLIDVSKGRRAASDYLAAAQVAGSISVDGATITVHTHIQYRPIMLSAFGVGVITVNGEATAETHRVYEGEVQ